MYVGMLHPREMGVTDGEAFLSMLTYCHQLRRNRAASGWLPSNLWIYFFKSKQVS
jgi:hypothetical protein